MDALPFEILSNIISYLDPREDRMAFMLTCTRFEEAGRVFFSRDPYFCWLVKHNKYTELKDLLTRGVPPPYRALEIAVNMQNDDITELLVGDGRINVSQHNNSLLQICVFKNFPSTLKILLSDRSTDPSKPNDKLIRCACKSNNYDIVELLLKDIRVNPFKFYTEEYYYHSITYVSAYSYADEIMKDIIKKYRTIP